MRPDVVFITGARSEYSPMRRALLELKKKIKIDIIATGMHLSPRFGYPVREIEKDGFNVYKVESLLDSDNLGGMVKSIGLSIFNITRVIEELSPKLILLEGDRGEALAGALVGAYLNVPVVHHGGGDLSGSIDNKIRFSITMLSDYHLVGNPRSYETLVKMGVPKEKIFLVGEPGVDDIYLKNYTPKEEIIKKYKIDSNNPSILLVFHPNTEEYSNIDNQLCEILNAIKTLKIKTIAIYSNSDAGGRNINQIIENYSKELSFFDVYKDIPREDFLGLMNVCDVMVGNSSAGIIELPAFKKPFVLIGNRQKNRLKTKNVIEVNPKFEEIINAIKKALYDKNFREELKYIKNPYNQEGKSYKIIAEVILNILDGEM